tara:strand:- start:12 stop:566 length:555 start_codon:yes stop_codon:yes gene_type:complete
MSEYLIVGGTTLLGQDSSGQYKLLPVPMGDPDKIAAMGEDALKGGAPRVVNMALQKGDTYVDVENLSDEQRTKLRGIAEDLTKGQGGSGGGMAFFTRSGMSDKINKLIDVISKIGGKAGGIMGLLDIMGMKKEYEQLMEGTHPMSSVFAEAGLLKPEAKGSTQVFKDGGYVSSNPIVEDIFDID